MYIPALANQQPLSMLSIAAKPYPHSDKVPVTVVIAGDVIYMAQENFHHWPLPRLQKLPPKDSLDPPFSNVEQKDITDIEQIVSTPL